jgi:hypothetical protein
LGRSVIALTAERRRNANHSLTPDESTSAALLNDYAVI